MLVFPVPYVMATYVMQFDEFNYKEKIDFNIHVLLRKLSTKNSGFRNSFLMNNKASTTLVLNQTL